MIERHMLPSWVEFFLIGILCGIVFNGWGDTIASALALSWLWECHARRVLYRKL